MYIPNELGIIQGLYVQSIKYVIASVENVKNATDIRHYKCIIIKVVFMCIYLLISSYSFVSVNRQLLRQPLCGSSVLSKLNYNVLI